MDSKVEISLNRIKNARKYLERLVEGGKFSRSVFSALDRTQEDAEEVLTYLTNNGALSQEVTTAIVFYSIRHGDESRALEILNKYIEFHFKKVK